MKVANVTIIIRGQAGETVKVVWDGQGKVQQGDPAAVDAIMQEINLEGPKPKKYAKPKAKRAPAPASTPGTPAEEPALPERLTRGRK
jgi:hypothetical protein